MRKKIKINKQRKSLKTNEKGFTLIELILYIALIAIFISGAITFAWDIVYGGAKSSVQREVNYNIRLASKRIAYEIRNASAINSVTSNSLCLASDISERNPTRIYVSSNQLRVAWGGGSSNCTGMTHDESLTSNQVTVSNLAFEDNSSGSDSFNIAYSLTVSKTGTRQEWQENQSYSGSAELRSF